MINRISVLKGLIPRRLRAGQAIRNPYKAIGEPQEWLLACPRCGVNSLLRDGDGVAIEFVDYIITVEPELTCPNCKLKFEIRASEVRANG